MVNRCAWLPPVVQKFGCVVLSLGWALGLSIWPRVVHAKDDVSVVQEQPLIFQLQPAGEFVVGEKLRFVVRIRNRGPKTAAFVLSPVLTWCSLSKVGENKTNGFIPAADPDDLLLCPGSKRVFLLSPREGFGLPIEVKAVPEPGAYIVTAEFRLQKLVKGKEIGSYECLGGEHFIGKVEVSLIVGVKRERRTDEPKR